MVTIKNCYQFLDLSTLTARWEVSEDGKVVVSGPLAVGVIRPGQEKNVTVPYSVQPKPSAEYWRALKRMGQLDSNLCLSGPYSAAEQCHALGCLSVLGYAVDRFGPKGRIIFVFRPFAGCFFCFHDKGNLLSPCLLLPYHLNFCVLIMLRG